MSDLQQRILHEAKQWPIRIVGLKMMPPSQLTHNPMNFRRHPSSQRSLFRAIASEIGIVAPVIENVRTGYLLDGHLRAEEAEAAGIDEIPVLQVDLDPDEEHVALAMFDAISTMAMEDAELKAELLKGIQTVPGDEALRDYLSRDLERQMAEAESHGSIDALKDKYGSYDPDDSLPVIKIKVSEETKRRWDSYFGGLSGHDDDKINWIMNKLGVPEIDDDTSD